MNYIRNKRKNRQQLFLGLTGLDVVNASTQFQKTKENLTEKIRPSP